MPGLSDTANLAIALVVVLGIGYLIFRIDRRVRREGGLFKRVDVQDNDESKLQETVLKEIRSWSFVLLILGIVHIFASDFLNSSWGILLIAVGLASFYFRSLAMLVVYGVMLAWAGITNFMSGQGGWILFAIIQGIWAFRVFQKFYNFQRQEIASEKESQDITRGKLTPERSAKMFPWAGFFLGGLSLIGIIGIFLGAIIYVIVTENENTPNFLGFVEGLIINFGVLGFAAGLASVLSGYQWRIVAILGMITGILALLIEFVLSLL